MRRLSPIVCALALLALAPVAQAVPAAFTHQARILDSLGAPLEGQYQVHFEIFDAAAGGASVWSETAPVTFTEGVMSHVLGGATPLDLDAFNVDNLYLSIAIDDAPALSPRVPLVSVPYAVRARSAALADRATAADTADFATTAESADFATTAETSTNLSGGVVDATEIRVNGTVVIDGSGGLQSQVSFADLLDVPDSLLDGDADTLASLSCSPGQLAQFDGSAWACANVESAQYQAGSGLALSGTSFSVDTNAIQARVSANCNPGQSIREIAANGTVTCEDDTDTTYSAASGGGLALSGANAFSVEAGGITGTHLANNAVTSAKIADGTIVAADLANNAVTGAKLAADAVTADKIADGSIEAAELASGAVTSVKLANNAVTSDKIVDGTIIGSDFANGAVTNAKLAGDAVTSDKIADGAVATADLANGSVTNPKLADNAVDSAKIANGSIGSADLGDASVSTLKIADNAVTSAKIADANVATQDLAADAVTSAKIADGTIVTADLADGAVNSAKILNGSIVAADVDTNSIQARVTGTCSVGQTITGINANGTVTCGSALGQLYKQTGNAAPQASSYTPTRYIVEAPVSSVGTVVPINVSIMNSLCKDDDGCTVSIQMVYWSASQPYNVASRGERLYISQQNGWWRFENNDLDGLDSNGGVHEWTPWDCYLTDAETATNNSNGRSDSREGWGLLNVRGGSYPDGTTYCRVVFDD